jgi:hypothetical protein
MYEKILDALGQIWEQLIAYNATCVKDYYKQGKEWKKILEYVEELKEKIAELSTTAHSDTAYIPNPADPEKPIPYEP